MQNDYRATKYCPPINELLQKKQRVADNIRVDHPRARDMHSYIKVNDFDYKKQFMEAYNYKCAYCGASVDIIPKAMFEIDHFINEKSFASKADAGFIENLVLSCHTCNHQKSSHWIKEDDRLNLNPDMEQIKQTFARDESFYIVVSEDCLEDQSIKEFHEKLKLDGEIHRLDYLLMNMIGLQRTLNAKPEAYSKIGQAIDLLRVKRNVL